MEDVGEGKLAQEAGAFSPFSSSPPQRTDHQPKDVVNFPRFCFGQNMVRYEGMEPSKRQELIGMVTVLVRRADDGSEQRVPMDLCLEPIRY